MAKVNGSPNNDLVQIINEIKAMLKDITTVSKSTKRDDDARLEISAYENPLNPNLLAYCFDNILGFEVQYRIFEKVNYVIEFSYKGTYATVGNYKMSYIVSVEKRFRDDLISLFSNVKPKLETLFLAIGELALCENNFSMLNEAPNYFEKLKFYEDQIEKLENKHNTISKKLQGKYDTVIYDKYKAMRPKGADYLRNLRQEITYDIEAYIDSFYSALEHVLTLLYPFTRQTTMTVSFYEKCIKNTKWSWDVKIKDVCDSSMPDDILLELRRIKEIYRNHNAHGGFSREMMAYIQIPKFGRYPLYIGKEYLHGFIEEESNNISYPMYTKARDVFNRFWAALDTSFIIPMMFIRSGLAIPADASIFMNGVDNAEKAQRKIDRMWFDIDNQSNMDW